MWTTYIMYVTPPIATQPAPSSVDDDMMAPSTASDATMVRPHCSISPLLSHTNALYSFPLSML